VKPETWRAVGRWLSVPPAFIVGLVAAYMGLMFSVLLDQKCIGLAQASGLSVPPSILLSLLDIAFIVLILGIWTTATVFAVGFALRTPKAHRFQWALTLAILLATVYVWAKHPSGLVAVSHLAAVGAGASLVCGVALSFYLAHKLRTHLLTNAIAFVILALPCWVAFAQAPKQPPSAQRLWSTALEKGTWQAMNTGSEFGATRQVAFAGDRVLAIFDAGHPQYEGTQPMSKYRLVSLDVKTGEIKNSREFSGRWGAMPYVFATNDGHVILEQGSLESLNPDLSEAGAKLDLDHGRVANVSPDGSTLAWEADPGMVLIDSRTLTPVGKLTGSVPSSFTRTAVLTNNISWRSDYPRDSTFVSLSDEHGSRLLFHGDCGFPAKFLNNDTVMLFGCGKIRTMDVWGTILKQADINGPARFAGASQNGRRFALEFFDERGDGPVLLYEYFTVFDTETLHPVAMVRISEMPERQSWSAFSPDGRYFAAGNPDDLSLFDLQ
jgi:hypothetical protein